MKRRGGRSLLGLGRNSMGSNSVSQWKMFQFFNVVLQAGPCPALAPRTTHTHTHVHAGPGTGQHFPPLPAGGLGMAALSFQHLQNKGGSVADTQPEASPPVGEQNAFPGPTLSTPEAGWAAEEGNWTPDFSRFCASPCQAVLSHRAGGGL